MSDQVEVVNKQVDQEGENELSKPVVHQVIVVGAGLSGLCACSRLLADNVDVLVLEASPRIGGRIWTVKVSSMLIVHKHRLT